MFRINKIFKRKISYQNTLLNKKSILYGDQSNINKKNIIRSLHKFDFNKNIQMENVSDKINDRLLDKLNLSLPYKNAMMKRVISNIETNRYDNDKGIVHDEYRFTTYDSLLLVNGDEKYAFIPNVIIEEHSIEDCNKVIIPYDSSISDVYDNIKDYCELCERAIYSSNEIFNILKKKQFREILRCVNSHILNEPSGLPSNDQLSNFLQYNAHNNNWCNIKQYLTTLDNVDGRFVQLETGYSLNICRQ